MNENMIHDRFHGPPLNGASITKVIAVTGGSGVGKSNVTLGMAICMVSAKAKKPYGTGCHQIANVDTGVGYSF